MANLPRAFGSLGHAGERRWAEIGFTWCARQIESGNAYFMTPVLELSGRQGIAGIEQINTPAEELFESRKLLLGTYLAGAIRVRNLLGAQAILAWALRGADIMQSGRARGEAYFRLESEESLALLLEHLPGFRLTDRNRLLAMLLDIWFGESFDLKESNWSPEKGRPFVEFDGNSLFYPGGDVQSRRGGARRAARGRPHALRHVRPAGDEGACSRAAKVDFPDSGPVSWAPVFMRYGDDALRFQLIFDLCEDLRVDFRIQQLVPNYLPRLLATARASAARHPASGALFRPRHRERRGSAGRDPSQRLPQPAFRAAARSGGDDRRCVSRRQGDLQQRRTAARRRSRCVSGGLSAGARPQCDAARAPAGAPRSAAADPGAGRTAGRVAAAGRAGGPDAAERGSRRSAGRRRAAAGPGSGRQQRLGDAIVEPFRAAARRRGQRQGRALSGMGLPRGALQAQLELGAGEEARRIQHGGNQPPDEAIRRCAEAAEKSHPVAEADAACAAVAAVRR